MRHSRAAALFDLALDVSASDQATWLETACAGDEALYAEVAALLRADARADGLLERPPRSFAAGSENAEDRMPDAFGPYRVLRRLGSGGMGEVWLARREDGQFDLLVAIKQVAYALPDLLRRFRRERRILAKLEHPNIARLIDGGTDAHGLPYLVMEYVEGEPLLKWCNEHRLGIGARIELFLSVCEAVQYAHRNLVVHRDLKPNNILINAEGRVKLLDFGIAKLLHEEGSDGERTGTQIKVLTPNYAAPEQVRGGAVTTATDTYQLGLVLYELLCGQRALRRPDSGGGYDVGARTPTRLSAAPFADGAPTAAIAAAHGTTAKALRGALRGDLERITQKALLEEPALRYENAGDLAADLRRYLRREPVLAARTSLRYRVGKFVQRNRWGVLFGALAMIAVLVGTAGIAWQAGRAREEAKAAIQTKNYLMQLLRLSDQTNSGVLSGSEVLDEAARQIEGLPGDDALRLVLANELVHIYNGKGERERAAKLAEAELGSPPDPRRCGDPAHLHLFLGWAWAKMDSMPADTLRPLLREVIDRYPDPNELDLANALSALARLDIDQDRYDEAEAGSRRALAVLGGRVPPSDDRVLNSRIDLAFALAAKRDWRGAREQSERALADTPASDTRARVHALAVAAPRRALFGEFASAEELYEQIEAIEGRTKFQTGYAYLHMLSQAENQFDLGRTSKAVQKLQELAELASALSMPGFAQNDESAWLHGEIALQAHDYTAAADYFASDANKAGRDDSGDAARRHVYLAALRIIALAEAGRMESAQALLAQLRARSAQASIENTYATAMVSAAEGVVADGLGKKSQAIAAFDQGLSELRNAKGHPAGLEEQLKENRDAVRIRAWKARAQFSAGSVADARRTWSEAQRIGASTLGDGHPFVLELERIAKQGRPRRGNSN